MKKHYNKILLLIIALGLGCALLLNWQRHQIELGAPSVESVMDYRAIARLASMEGMPVQEALQAFKQRGVNTLALYDQSLNSLQEKGSLIVLDGVKLLADKETGSLSPVLQQVVNSPSFTIDAVYLMAGNSQTALGEVEEDFRLRLGAERCRVVHANPKIVQLTGDTIIMKDPANPGEQVGLRELPLGLSTDELKLAQTNGFQVMMRPSNYAEAVTATAASAQAKEDALFRRIDASGAKVTSYSPAGKETLGYGVNMDYVAKQLQQRHILLSMVEGVTQLQFIPMKGLTEMAALMDYQVARTYTIDKQEQKKLTVYGAARRWALSDEERNIRINLIKTFLTPQGGKTLMQTNLDYVQQVNDSVIAKGYLTGKPSSFAAYSPAVIWFVPLAFAVAAAWGLYGGFIFSSNAKLQYWWTFVVGGLLSLGLFTGMSLTMRHIIALGAATIFPVLSMHFVMRQWERRTDVEPNLTGIAVAATWRLIVAVLLSLVGAAILGAILGDIRFFLEIDIYRGVKLTFMLPLILMAILFFRYHSLWEGDDLQKSLSKRLVVLLHQPFTFKTLCFLGALLIIAWVFIGRSGHTAGVPVPAFEMKMRYFLEQVMYARPREKEFLIGHPAFYLAAYAAFKKLPHLLYMAFVLAATIGQASLVQTFCHMRSPIFMSYVRAFDGLGLGIVMGIIALVIFAAVYPRWCSWQRRNFLDE
ncbi:MAG: DUF5693 family protein [Acidaminococcaceae bacterium]|nr:DUF5693 family protein [Acidaminococcaceae bacterium]